MNFSKFDAIETIRLICDSLIIYSINIKVKTLRIVFETISQIYHTEKRKKERKKLRNNRNKIDS